MPIYTLTILDKQTVAAQTVLLKLNKPEGFTFLPGQYGGFTLIQPKATDEKGNTRRFSLLSTPNDPYLAIVTRIQTSAYKHCLNQLIAGDTLKFAGPTGQFILPKDPLEPVALIAGGMGIAPFYSMVLASYQAQLTRPIYLFYGNTTLSSTAFYQELKNLAECYSAFHFIPLLDTPDATWEGETGFISADIIKKHLPDKEAFTYFVCGAPMMVASVQESLLKLGIHQNKINVEDFPGY